ncbi:MAG: apolipoprotein N-acyltransferase [Cypionkella sp.]|nr:apolipoprotein N-acyltransferase [Cypionkella sp.]
MARRALPAGKWRAGLAAFCLGVIAAAGQAPFDLWFLTIAALAVLLAMGVGLRARPARAVFTLWMGGAGYFCAALSWIISPFLVEPETYGWMAPFAVLGMGFGLSLFWALAAKVGLRAKRPLLGMAVALAASEMARGYLLTGFPWALLGHIWIDTPVAQLAALIGPNGLTLLTTVVAAAIAGGGLWGRLAGAAGLAAAWGAGVWVLAQSMMPADTAITLRLVQPNAAQSLKWDEGRAHEFYGRLISATSLVPTPDLVIWPETALPYLQEYNPEITADMARAAGGATLIYGRQRIDGDRGYNSLSVLPPDGREAALYDKHHLVPFGEYIPFGDLAYEWLGLTAFAARLGNGYTAGTGPQVIDLGRFGKMLPLICYEAVFPQDLRTASRPDWLLHITNDAWFGTLTGPFQHAAQSRLRAIEQGLPMVRVANTGVTGVYDARGRLRADIPFGTQAHLDTVLPAPLPITPFAAIGEWPALVLLFGGCIAAFAPARRRKH